MKSPKEIPRLLGTFPLSLFMLSAYQAFSANTPGDLLWMCNASVALLGFAILSRQSKMARMSALWLIPGLPIWAIEAFRGGPFSIISTVTHMGEASFAIFLFLRYGSVPGLAIWGTLWFIFLQSVARFTTPPTLNVNMAHEIWHGWNILFGAYWQYWVFTVLSSLAGLYLLNRAILFLAQSVTSSPAIAENDQERSSI